MSDAESPTEFGAGPTTDDGFEAVMAYYHLDKSQRYVQSLDVGRPIQQAPVRVNPQGRSDDLSGYTASDNALVFGIGGTEADDALFAFSAGGERRVRVRRDDGEVRRLRDRDLLERVLDPPHGAEEPDEGGGGAGGGEEGDHAARVLEPGNGREVLVDRGVRVGQARRAQPLRLFEAAGLEADQSEVVVVKLAVGAAEHVVQLVEE